VSLLLHRSAERVCREEERRLLLDERLSWEIHGRILTITTGESFSWVQGSGWVRPDGSRADGRKPLGSRPIRDEGQTTARHSLPGSWER